ncbi:hypothetical protein BP1258A_5572 [Burkholderia pseudomallei 1258a]|uniref:Uncharacterized protein n=1 Tax=Burkholderia pseudomallei (strain 1026b) TaxID=884204 RepID=A0A0H3HNI9_BURP2|nr:hypothetical protein BP1026B_I3272 [Burkholderia pseudomallei 1026b]EIF52585.1 hypothetical protein BP1026A_6040 [Burkholderia pseudomallei 1026a]EIF52961.1 hypothetical protein BP1258A_5572 [Burkholderia pseudomallei 1258a]EIF63883.1 hypothetical protein BP1258B_2771 [Burkholderia pseudomallei 1258b]EIF68969.1 hypothetical protein BP354E_5886 [Burkholderia pseudomallei 354e]EIF79851.1 hypothetical protein BP354A_2915 [Burkholderia pseudomallei 354a]
MATWLQNVIFVSQNSYNFPLVCGICLSVFVLHREHPDV